MMNIKFVLVFIIINLIFRLNSHAIEREHDLECSGKINNNKKIEIIITNLKLSKEVIVRAGNNNCIYKIVGLDYMPDSITKTLTINLEKTLNCDYSKNYNIKFLENGFIKIDNFPQNETAYVLFLYDNNSIRCSVTKINFKNFSSFLKK